MNSLNLSSGLRKHYKETQPVKKLSKWKPTLVEVSDFDKITIDWILAGGS